MMDRVIYAYGARGDLQFTLFRPFNWMGPQLDNVWSNKGKSSRVVSQFLATFSTIAISRLWVTEARGVVLYISTMLSKR